MVYLHFALSSKALSHVQGSNAKKCMVIIHDALNMMYYVCLYLLTIYWVVAGQRFQFKVNGCLQSQVNVIMISVVELF